MDIVKTKFKPVNGFTKAKIKAVLEKEVKEFSGYTERCGSPMSDVTRCFYKDNKGNKCAIGAFIPEGHPGQKFIGTVNNLLNAHPDLRTFMPLEDAALMPFQVAHDTNKKATKQALLKWVDANVEG